jgi:hypothetical protein
MNYLSLLISGYWTAIGKGGLPWGEIAKTEVFLNFYRNFVKNSVKYIDNFRQNRESILKADYEESRLHDIDDSFYLIILAIRQWITHQNVEEFPKIEFISGTIKVYRGAQHKMYKDNEKEFLSYLISEQENFINHLKNHFGNMTDTRINKRTMRIVMGHLFEIKKIIQALELKQSL